MDCQTENCGCDCPAVPCRANGVRQRIRLEQSQGNAVGVGQGRICNTALRIHVIVPRNCDK
ncbi:TPA: hypothetical protein JDY68_03720 [Clostridioides difficile]|nr:hypothetical protein [Clostridioides difficile]EGT3809937.1 hypothetical protein [Clostridioides difficile]EGT3863198.1 hypothetical protein [Clostridioides difficile]EGT4770057.1 hypothetical protein [Clostridioides difficile]EGT4996191.1 hypothetical protein [Clostridioides difficile]